MKYHYGIRFDLKKMDQNCQENCLYCSQTMAQSSINRDCRIYYPNQVPGSIPIAEDTYVKTIMRCKGLRMKNQNLRANSETPQDTRSYGISPKFHPNTKKYTLAYKANEDRFEIENRLIFYECQICNNELRRTDDSCDISL